MRAIWLLVFVVACSEQRVATDSVGGAHPPGWADRASPAFHATWIAANGFPLPRCQQCHGDDYAGGATGVSCTQANCHAEPPIACTTCHGSRGTPRPDAGAHWAHQAFCATCHDVPTETTASVQKHANGSASTLVQFSGLALVSASDWRSDAGAVTPVWDPGAKRCANTYCHGALSPVWTTSTPIDCNGCHHAPPDNHAPWARVATGTASCTTCHPAPSGPTHVNGRVDLSVTDCTTCHGSNGHPNPPLSLGGSTDPATRGVGAHERHLDSALVDRISTPLLCNDCHVDPASVTQPGHLDEPTVVRFPFGGTYDATGPSCNVWCHWNRTPGPTWTDDSGGARKCDACHAFPPVLTRTGNPHPSVLGELSACVRCHVFGPSTHVNGVVDFVSP